MKLPTDAPRNQTPIIRPATRAGASFVIELRPTGLRHSSAQVCSRYVPINHIGLTSAPPALMPAAGTSSAKPRPAPINPSENFTGVDGSLDPRRIHSHAKTGANTMMKSAFADWNQLLGKFQPNMEFRVARSANRLRVEPACSNTDQKMAAARKNTPIA